MRIWKLLVWATAVGALAAEAPLPELKVEAVAAGSVVKVRNPSKAALSAMLIELVGYPGSGFTLYQDDLGAAAIPPGEERSYPVTNMTIGAAPEYVKVTAALYEDGSAAGDPAKVAQLRERRNARVAAAKELVQRLEKGATAAELEQWAASVGDRNAKGVIGGAVSELRTKSREEVLGRLRGNLSRVK